VVSPTFEDHEVTHQAVDAGAGLGCQLPGRGVCYRRGVVEFVGAPRQRTRIPQQRGHHFRRRWIRDVGVLFEQVDAALDGVAVSVAVRIEHRRSPTPGALLTPVLRLIGLDRDGRRDASPAQVGPVARRGVGLIGQHPVRGVLIGQAGISADEAFEVLRLRSQSLNIKLRDVAAEVIAEAARQR
jgi:hypothetical protein